MRISELARQAGTTPRALRYYEEQGLLHPARLASGYRQYDEQALRAVRHIQLLLSAGLNTTAIAEILPCIPDDVTVLAPTCPELLDELAAERARITRSMQQLGAARDVLDRLLQNDPR
ncbi:MerR family transcriptional regulator [Actinoplanes awajinensis]|uniref:MerR family transcriptional regulator n=1 Tax=Actinoplanes awajinensis subsp. mycoplanecinus TaxID=135947 RepID=A0A101JET1_9ACTN|nr:MerR family transcriptional regulator [Actinoplanes awajinensis]KUL25433.1 MerR family transcriptional regulator [Actinoplanes awajinensis subsp. mycoplanecinus]